MGRPLARNGMTLMEVMVSLGLITLLGGGILALIVENTKAGQTMDYNYAAINIAKSRMDRVRELRRDKGYNNLSTAAETDITVDREGSPSENGKLKRSTSIITNFEGKENLTKVIVTVKYKDLSSINTTTITITTLLSPYI